MITRLTIRADQPQGPINPNVYGQFAEHLGRSIYEGLWVGEDSPIPHTRGLRNDVVAALRQLRVPVLRWPGGCFADEYHWKDGIGPREHRPSMINTHWGGVVENNHFGTHEFFDLCEQLGCAPYVCGNVGSGTVREMMEWVEYMTSDADSPMASLRRHHGREQPWRLPYFGVGNESWGCGGNMRPEYYADLYRRYNTYVKNYAGHRIARIAGGANVDDYRWTETLMAQAGRLMDGLSLHYYTIPSGDFLHKGPAFGFGEDAWHGTLFQALRMDELITKHGAIMDRFDPEKRVGLIVDEWGTWYDADPGTNPGFLYQQNTLRDALVAALGLHVFHRHHARVTMANIAQMVNVLQSMIATRGAEMVLTPTFHVFEMYQPHQGATVLPVEGTAPDYTLGGVTLPGVHATASRGPDGALNLGLVNLRPDQPAEVAVRVAGGAATGHHVTGRLLTAGEMDTRNTFEQPHALAPAPFPGLTTTDGEVTFTLPAKSVASLALR